jgi:hypothetical protein
MNRLHCIEVELVDEPQTPEAALEPYVGAVVERIIMEPEPRVKVVGEFGLAPGTVEALRNMIADWLEHVLGDLYRDLAEQTGKVPRWFAERDAHQLVAGEWLQIGWKNSRSGKYTPRAEGRVIEWFRGAAVLHDAEQDVTYYPIFLAAVIRR